MSDYVDVTVNNAQIYSENILNNGDLLKVDEFSLTFEFESAHNIQETPEVIDEVDDSTENTAVIEDRTETIQEDFSAEDDGTLTVAEEPVDYTEALDDTVEEEAPQTLDDFDQSFDESELTENNFETPSDETMGEDEMLDDYADSYDDEYAVDSYDDDEGTKVLSGFAKFSLELFGEFAPYDTFNIEDSEVFIGRDPKKCKIVLADPEVSSVHAVLRKNNITCTLEDLQSGNGTILNGKRINKKDITNGDEFIIGGTTFTVRIGSEFIDSQKGMLMPVEENQVVEVEEIVEVMDGDDADFDGGEGIDSSSLGGNSSLFSKEALKDPQKRKKLLIYAVVLVALWIFLDDGEQPATETAKKANAKKNEKVVEAQKPTESKLTPEQAAQAESLYQLGQAFLVEGKYPEAIAEFEKLFLIKKDYKEAIQLNQLAKEKLAQLEKAELERRAEEERAIRKKKVQELLEKAEVAVKERNVSSAENLFVKIREIDPDNYDVTNLEIDLNAWKKEKAEKELAEAQKIAERKRMVDSLAPGKALYLKEEWYRAIGELEKFLTIKSMDEDLIKEGTDMLKESKAKLGEVVEPLLGKARSLKEGEDLKGAYNVYNEILKYDPTSVEALNEMDDIKFTLTSRAQKIYREAIIAESLGLFEKAKEKFQEIQQITPEDNEYYIKSTDRLRNL
ncbi:FHA domain protein [Bacteriovorax sp. Seq25_V]|nr:FHA domain protein [Bacteriovorax sp. Seq25_V]